MKNFFVAALALVVAGFLALPGGAAAAEGHSGETLFKQNCASCHPEGGNIINPQKTLQQKSRAVNNVKTAEDIIKVMRNPGPGMTKFDAKTIPDKHARMIADYIILTYK